MSRGSGNPKRFLHPQGAPGGEDEDGSHGRMGPIPARTPFWISDAPPRVEASPGRAAWRRRGDWVLDETKKPPPTLRGLLSHRAASAECQLRSSARRFNPQVPKHLVCVAGFGSGLASFQPTGAGAPDLRLVSQEISEANAPGTPPISSLIRTILRPSPQTKSEPNFFLTIFAAAMIGLASGGGIGLALGNPSCVRGISLHRSAISSRDTGPGGRAESHYSSTSSPTALSRCLARSSLEALV